MPFSRLDQHWMRLALSFGERGLGRTWPNPSVACHIVSNSRIIARGRTEIGGRPHAESIALGRARDQSDGATAYVTLEPCSHTGKTGPCAELLANSGIARVVTPLSDPDERVSGTGHRLLRKAGVRVESGCLEEGAIRSHLGFLLRAVHGRPMVALKLAHSLDGRVATGTGESKWITGSASRRLVHVMRSRHDAVMVGRGTALSDDPRLTPRGIGADHLPVRIVLDTNLSAPVDSNLGNSARDGPVWICHGADAPESGRDAWREAGAETIECGAARISGLDLAIVMKHLAERGLTRIFCEGGPRLASSLIRGGLVDRFISFSSGTVLGSDAMPMFDQLNCRNIADAFRFTLQQQIRVDGDVMSVWSQPIASYGFRNRRFC